MPREFVDWQECAIGGREDRLRILWAEGKTKAEIAQMLGINKTAVASRIRKLRLPKRDGSKRAIDPKAAKPAKRAKPSRLDFFNPTPTGCKAVLDHHSNRVEYCNGPVDRLSFCRWHASTFLRPAGGREAQEAMSAEGWQG